MQLKLWTAAHLYVWFKTLSSPQNFCSVVTLAHKHTNYSFANRHHRIINNNIIIILISWLWFNHLVTDLIVWNKIKQKRKNMKKKRILFTPNPYLEFIPWFFHWTWICELSLHKLSVSVFYELASVKLPCNGSYLAFNAGLHTDTGGRRTPSGFKSAKFQSECVLKTSWLSQSAVKTSIFSASLSRSWPSESPRATGRLVKCLEHQLVTSEWWQTFFFTAFVSHQWAADRDTEKLKTSNTAGEEGLKILCGNSRNTVHLIRVAWCHVGSGWRSQNYCWWR